MRRHLPWLLWGPLAVICALCALTTSASAQQQPVKPYVLFILDTSGSMDDAGSGAVTGFGPPSCPGTIDTKEDHAKCAIFNVTNSYDEMVLGLGKFRSTYNTAGICDGANECSHTAFGCGGNDTGDELQMLVPIVADNAGSLLGFTDFVCDSCDVTTGNPEIWSSGSTPLAGSLRGAKRYWTALDSPTFGPYWTGPGDDPITDDPLNQVFSSPTEQCRPYITILLTDGDETCAAFTVTEAATTELLTTVFDGDNDGDTESYRIETKPIGFGKLPGDTEIESIAHLGGEPDRGRCSVTTTTFCFVNGDCPMPQTCNLAGVFEGAYAQNEEELQLEISQIIADAIKFEQCNEIDDDCDIAADEDFRPPFGNKGLACDDGEYGICRGTGTFICNAAFTGTECVITSGGGTAIAETCNGFDDDCDSFVDEGTSCSCGGVELCNGIDDDCDIPEEIDEGITQQCGSDIGICDFGVEICDFDDNPTHFTGCTANPLPGDIAETCNRCDDDCDGTVDGFGQQCSDLPGGINPDTGLCHYGTQVCPTSAPGTCPTVSPFGPCLGEVVPATEVCDTLDNDCDGEVDEDTGGEDCSSACGIGTTVCDMGTIECSTTTTMTDDTCNNIDDNCNGVIDEGAPPGRACVGGANDRDLCLIAADCPGGTCELGCDGPPSSPGSICMGDLVCTAGVYVCVGDGVTPETCNCEDDNCNNQVDEGTLCATGSTCVHPNTGGFACQCAEPCGAGEFPCGIGRTCVEGFCLVDPCFGVTCGLDGNGDATECDGGVCVRACDSVNCPTPLICFGPTGECAPDDCTTFPDRCTSDQLCVGGACVTDPCNGVTCDSGQYCADPDGNGDGECYASCAGVDCPDGQRCLLGACELDPCGSACPNGQVCDDDSGECQDDPCPNQNCPQGEWCNPQNGICEQDPCVGVECPTAEETCVGGTCFGPEFFVDAGAGPDADPDKITTGGGGGCADVGGNAGAGALLVIALGLVLRRSRRPEVRS